MMTFCRKVAWEIRRIERKYHMPTPDAVVNAAAAWLNGNERAAMHEGLMVESATVSDTTIIITFQPTVEGQLPFRASFQLRAMESQEMARRHYSQSERQEESL